MKIIITENQYKNLELRRNLSDKLPKFITATMSWLDPKRFNSFDEFLERVIFSSTRDYCGEFIKDPKNYWISVEIMKPIVEKIVMDEYFDEILNYYNRQTNS